MQWTEIKDGKECNWLMKLWSMQKVLVPTRPWKPLKKIMLMILPMNLLSQRL